MAPSQVQKKKVNPSTLNPKPLTGILKTLNPNSQTRNLQPSTQILRHLTLSPKPYAGASRRSRAPQDRRHVHSHVEGWSTDD
jgi:hypothetical protein